MLIKRRREFANLRLLHGLTVSIPNGVVLAVPPLEALVLAGSPFDLHAGAAPVGDSLDQILLALIRNLEERDSVDLLQVRVVDDAVD